MKNYHVVQVTFLQPMIEALWESGAPVERLLKLAGMDKFRLDDPKAVVPLSCAYEFFEIVARHETGPTLPHEVSSRYKVGNLHEWGEYVLDCPDMLTVCQTASHPDGHLFSCETLDLSIEGDSAWLTNVIHTAPGLGKNWTEYLTACLMIDGFRQAGDDDWIPLDLHISDENSYGHIEALSEGGAAVSTARNEVAIRFPTEFLAESPRASTSRRDSDEGWRGLSIGETTAARIERVLDSSAEDGPPTIKTVARTADISSRSLQRRLNDEDTSFSEVIDNWRFKRALQLIRNPDYSVREIADSLRYSESPHFIRAFQRWTGTTPQRFRDAPPARF